MKVVSGKYSGIVARIEERDVRKGLAAVLLRSASSFIDYSQIHGNLVAFFSDFESR